MMAFGEQYAHRVSYIIHNGPIKGGLEVMHSCDNPSCVNPEHLSLGSHSDNMGDMVEKYRSKHGESHRSAKLSETQVLKLRSGSCYRLMARIAGVTDTTARHAQIGVTWKYLNQVASPL